LQYNLKLRKQIMQTTILKIKQIMSASQKQNLEKNYVNLYKI
jgi:hypothetical protein